MISARMNENNLTNENDSINTILMNSESSFEIIKNYGDDHVVD